MHKKLNKMNLSNPTVIIVVVVLLMLSSTVVIFFPMISEQQQQQDKPGSVLKLAKANVSIDIPIS
jgi:flagellar basal body-associated protein FliL